MVRDMKEIRHDSSDFASSDSDKSDWDACTGCISNPDSVDFNDDVTAAMSGHAVVVDSNDETKICTCNIESECQIVTAKEGLRSLKILSTMTHVVLMVNYSLICSLLKRTCKGNY
jgi:hypothetical protein